MPANRNALIRYKVIDSCLQRRNRKWTLEDLIKHVSEALYEYEGMDKGISKRTIQADIQMMRSDKLGYFAPIVVLDKKYYSYKDPNYSITNIPISDADLGRMNEAVELLKQFKGFSHFQQLNEVVQKLEDHVYSVANKKRSIIDFEKNDNLRGLSHLDLLYNSVIHKKTVQMTYQSFKARAASVFFFHVWWLKEFKNRWFAVGVRNGQKTVIHLALDRILELSLDEKIAYRENTDLDPELYYKDTIGVTVSENMRAENVQIWVNTEHAPYVETKPLHHSQIVLERLDDGINIQIQVQLNFELEKEILGFGEGMKVLVPEKLKKRIFYRIEKAAVSYKLPESS
jgi:predicted DNA-binding transcriptional regulator YafY